LAWYHFEQSRGTLHQAEQSFLDFLVAAGRDSFLRNRSTDGKDVLVVEFRQQDQAEYSAWPPAPLDYIVALKRLAPLDPEVVMFAAPMNWNADQAQFLTQLRQRWLSVPSVILPYDLRASADGQSPEELDFFQHDLPVLPQWEGKRTPALHFAGVENLPNKLLWPAAQLGFLKTGAPPSASEAPLVATDGKRLAPSLAAQAITAFRKAPFAELRLRFGNGARLSLGDHYIVPLDKAGAVSLKTQIDLTTINALDLMTPDLGTESDQPLKNALASHKHKCVVFTLSSLPESKLQAEALAMALAMPEVRQASRAVTWSLAVIACLLGCWQLRYHRFGALVFGAATSLAGLVSSLIVFSSALIWWPPILPATVLVVSTVFCFLWPAKRHTPEEEFIPYEFAPTPTPTPRAEAPPSQSSEP
jgi:hypothetical protein